MLCALRKTLTDCKGGGGNGPAPFVCHEICDSDPWNRARVDATSALYRGLRVCFNSQTRRTVDVF